MIIVVYVVFVLFGFYLLYMYDPVSMHRLFSWLFNPFIEQMPAYVWNGRVKPGHDEAAGRARHYSLGRA